MQVEAGFVIRRHHEYYSWPAQFQETTIRKLFWLAIVVTLLQPCFARATESDCVVLLHGLARTASSMDKMTDAFSREGYRTVNRGYPSCAHPIEQLADSAVESGISDCPETGQIHFVTHSLGGILVRFYFADNHHPRLGRVVMLAPPNQGSEVVDQLKSLPGFKLLNGPAGLQLGTDEKSIPRQLGPIAFELGVIAGSRTINVILSQFLTNPDDGKVSVESTRVEGMADFLVMPVSHPFIMRSDDVIHQTLTFIRTGQFSPVQ